MAELTVWGRLSWVPFLLLVGWGDGAREEAGELSERRPEVKRGEYWANITEEVEQGEAGVVGDVEEDDEERGRDGEERRREGSRLYTSQGLARTKLMTPGPASIVKSPV